MLGHMGMGVQYCRQKLVLVCCFSFCTLGEGRREGRGGERRGEEGRGGERRGEEGRGERREGGNKIITSNFMHFLCHAGHLKVGTHFNYLSFQPPSALYSNPKHAPQGHPMQWLLPFRVK